MKKGSGKMTRIPGRYRTISSGQVNFWLYFSYFCRNDFFSSYFSYCTPVEHNIIFLTFPVTLWHIFLTFLGTRYNIFPSFADTLYINV